LVKQKSGISLVLHSPHLNLCNFFPSIEEGLKASTQNTKFSVSPAGVQQAICVCYVWHMHVRPSIPFPVPCVNRLSKNLILTTIHWTKTSAPHLHSKWTVSNCCITWYHTKLPAWRVMWAGW
jgi:hypothetical protein